MLTNCNANAKIPNFRPSNAAPFIVPPGAAALPRPHCLYVSPYLLAHISVDECE